MRIKINGEYFDIDSQRIEVGTGSSREFSDAAAWVVVAIGIGLIGWVMTW